MGFGQKRKRPWGSQGFFGFRPAKQVLESLLRDAETPGQSGALDGLIEGSSSEDANFSSSANSNKIRRSGSKILSVIRSSRFSGMCIKAQRMLT